MNSQAIQTDEQLSGFARAKASCVKAAMEVFFALQTQGRAASECVFKAQMAFEEAAWQRRAELPELLCEGGIIKRPSRATVYGWAKRVQVAGGIEVAPIEAYAAKLCKEVPEEFMAGLRSIAAERGSCAAALRKYHLDWYNGREVPGFGKPVRAGDMLPLPVSESWLMKRMPGKAVRVVASRGKFAAKTMGLLAAPALDTETLRLHAAETLNPGESLPENTLPTQLT